MEKVEIRLMKTDGIMKACLDENLRLNAKNTTRLDTMCGAIPTECLVCGVFSRIEQLCECERNENDSN